MRAFGWLVGAAGIALGIIAASHARRAAHADALWRIVHEQCVTATAVAGGPGQCRYVDRKGRYAVLKDLRGRSHFLILPTERVSGIEAPVVRTRAFLEYWKAAWSARQLVAQSVDRRLERSEIGMSVNSLRSRSQDQLHIHLDCVQPALQDALAAHEREIGTQWSSKRLLLAGRWYYVKKLEGEELAPPDPFQQLAGRLRDPAVEMGEHSLSVIGARFGDGRPGFYLLDSPVGWRSASADDVLDRDCAGRTATNPRNSSSHFANR